MMMTAEKIKEAITLLPEKEYIKLRKWFSENDWKKWDTQIERDSKDGKLDFLVEEALREKHKETLSHF